MYRFLLVWIFYLFFTKLHQSPSIYYYLYVSSYCASPTAPPPGIHIPLGTEVLYFKLNQDQLNTRVKQTFLHVWLKPITSELDRFVPISVFKVTRPENPGDFITLTVSAIIQLAFINNSVIIALEKFPQIKLLVLKKIYISVRRISIW